MNPLFADELAEVRGRIEHMGYGVVALRTARGHDAKLFIQADDCEVKVEVNYVFRGTVMPVTTRELVPFARRRFAAGVVLPVIRTPTFSACPRCSGSF
jgi:hypothetical protein